MCKRVTSDQREAEEARDAKVTREERGRKAVGRCVAARGRKETAAGKCTHRRSQARQPVDRREGAEAWEREKR